MRYIVGPYLVFNAKNQPEKWCCFHFDENQHPPSVHVYEATYVHTHPKVLQWQHREQCAQNEPEVFYVRDLSVKVSSGYLVKGGRLYQIPMYAGGTVNRVDEPLCGNKMLRWIMTKERIKAKDFNVLAERFPIVTPDMQFKLQGATPELPSALTTLPQVTNTVYTAFSIDDAREHLLPRQCHRTDGAIPENHLSPNVMYVWKNEKNIWHYQTLLFSEKKEGVLEPSLDKQIIQFLEKMALDQKIDRKDNEVLFNNLMRPYLHLTHAQQNKINAAFAPEWPLLERFSPEEQRRICVAIIKKQRLEGELGTEADAFRRLMVSSSLANFILNMPDFYPKEATWPGFDVTLADVWKYVQCLLLASANALGQVDNLVMSPPPSDSHVRANQYKFLESQQLLYIGLSTFGNELYNLVLTASHRGITELTFEQLCAYRKYLELIIGNQQNRATYQEQSTMQEVADDLLASISAQYHISNSEAKRRLDKQCKGILNVIINAQLSILLSQYDHNQDQDLWRKKLEDILVKEQDLSELSTFLSEEHKTKLFEIFLTEMTPQNYQKIFVNQHVFRKISIQKQQSILKRNTFIDVVCTFPISHLECIIHDIQDIEVQTTILEMIKGNGQKLFKSGEDWVDIFSVLKKELRRDFVQYLIQSHLNLIDTVSRFTLCHGVLSETEQQQFREQHFIKLCSLIKNSGDYLELHQSLLFSALSPEQQTQITQHFISLFSSQEFKGLYRKRIADLLSLLSVLNLEQKKAVIAKLDHEDMATFPHEQPPQKMLSDKLIEMLMLLDKAQREIFMTTLHKISLNHQKKPNGLGQLNHEGVTLLSLAVKNLDNFKAMIEVWPAQDLLNALKYRRASTQISDVCLLKNLMSYHPTQRPSLEVRVETIKLIFSKLPENQWKAFIDELFQQNNLNRYNYDNYQFLADACLPDFPHAHETILKIGQHRQRLSNVEMNADVKRHLQEIKDGQSCFNLAQLNKINALLHELKQEKPYRFFIPYGQSKLEKIEALELLKKASYESNALNALGQINKLDNIESIRSGLESRVNQLLDELTTDATTRCKQFKK